MTNRRQVSTQWIRVAVAALATAAVLRSAGAAAPGDQRPVAGTNGAASLASTAGDTAFLLRQRRFGGAPMFDFVTDSGQHDMLENNTALRDGILAGTADFVPKPEDKRKYYGEYVLTGWWTRNQKMFRQLHAMAYQYDQIRTSHWSEPYVQCGNGGKGGTNGEMVSVDIDIPEAGAYNVWVLASGKCRFWCKDPAGARVGGNINANPFAWSWMRVREPNGNDPANLPKGTSKFSISSFGEAPLRVAAVMLVDTSAQVTPVAPQIPAGKGIVTMVLRKDDPRTRLGSGAAWGHTPQVPEEAERYARAVIVALKDIGKYYLEYPRIDWKGSDADRGGKSGGPNSHLSALGYHALQESWMMALFIRVWDRMRFWDVLSDDDYLAIMQTFIMPAAEYMHRSPIWGYTNMAMETRSRVSYWALLLGKDDWLRETYEGQCGFKDQLKRSFSDEGWLFEGHYHSHAVDPMLFWAEMYVKAGYPVEEIYNADFKRLFTAYLMKAPFWNGEYIIQSDIAAKRFNDPVLARYNVPEVLAKIPSANMPSLGFTALRRNIGGQLYAMGMNWGIHEKRNAPDRMGVFISAPFFSVYRMTYNNLSIDQATIVVDGQNQKPPSGANEKGARLNAPDRGRLDQYVPEGPAAIIAASHEGLYDGVTIYRTAISLDNGAFLIIDRAASATEHTYDWPGTGIQQPEGVMFAARSNALGVANGYNGYDRAAAVEGPWGVRDAGKAIMVLPWPNTLLAQKTTFPEAWRGTNTVIRRAGATVDAGIAYVPTTNSAAAQFRWKEQGGERVSAQLNADGAEWLITLDYAAKPERRCTVTRR
jgi:hypothetical protein